MPTLTTSGSPTFPGDSTCLIDATGSDRVQVPDVTLLRTTQMWIAIRVKPTWGTTDAVERTFFRWGPNTSDELFMQYGPTAATWTAGRDGTGAGAGGQPTHSGVGFAANTDQTFIAAWTPGGIGISFEGSALLWATNARVCLNSSATTWDIGQRGYSFTGIVDTAYHWVAAGIGTLTDANCATIHFLGNTDPGFTGFPVPLTFYWDCTSTTYLSEMPTGSVDPDYSHFPRVKMRSA